ncbi:MAG: hypothetical protein NWE94_01120 [Candidatus Bathyarchaeota archaeon]|nr:hypothetical protein [Candidatus Bathyarchaeota archaeon]
MKNKLATGLLLLTLLFSALPVAALAATECPTCHGTGTIDCPRCNGTGKISSSESAEACETCQGTGVVTPTISNKGTNAWVSDEAAYIKGLFQNEEDIGVYGKAVAEVYASTRTYTNTSSRIYFPPHETIEIIVAIGEISYSDYRYLSQQRYLRARIYVSEVDEITCPYCGGTGTASQLSDCPECHGTGLVTCPACGGSLIYGEGKNETAASFPLAEGAVVAVGSVAAVAAAILVVKKKQVSEEHLKRMPFYEFQNWVVQRLSGRISSTEDSRIGINGYTAEGHPIYIRQSDDVGRDIIDSFVTTMLRRKARTGVIVAFGFGTGVYEGIARAKIYHRLEINAVTVKELIENRAIITL